MVGSMLLAGTATAFNAGVILHKVRNGRELDALVDLTVAGVMSAMYAGTLGGMYIAMIASFLFSIYLWFFPVELPHIDMTNFRKYALRTTVAVGILGLIVVANVYGLTIVAMLA